MSYSREEFAKHMRNWNSLLNDYKIPSWEVLPSIDLYMDQVIVLMTQYLNTFLTTNTDAPLITPPMINNYVKLRAMPSPVKKKYSRIHIAYLIMISSLKQALSIPTIQKILPLYEDEEKVKELFNTFCTNQHKAFSYITQKVCDVTDPILESEEEDPKRMYDLAIQIAVSANVFKMLSEDVTNIKHIDITETTEE